MYYDQDKPKEPKKTGSIFGKNSPAWIIYSMGLAVIILITCFATMSWPIVLAPVIPTLLAMTIIVVGTIRNNRGERM